MVKKLNFYFCLLYKYKAQNGVNIRNEKKKSNNKYKVEVEEKNISEYGYNKRCHLK